MVAGAGIAGSVLTRMLRDRGHEVILIDSRPYRAASRCAFAYLRLAWWKGAERDEVRRAVDWYEGNSWVRSRTGVVHDLRRGWTREQRDHVLVNSRGPLVRPDMAVDLSGYWDGPGGVAVLVGDRLRLDAHRLVIACGAQTDRWAQGSPVYGGIYEVPGAHTEGALNLLRVTDRMTFTAAYDGARTRVGASKGLTPEKARERADRIFERMTDAGIIDPSAPWEYRAGTRWEHLGGAPGGPRRLSENVWTFAGFARSGYARVPEAARRLAERIEER